MYQSQVEEIEWFFGNNDTSITVFNRGTYIRGLIRIMSAQISRIRRKSKQLWGEFEDNLPGGRTKKFVGVDTLEGDDELILQEID